MEKSRVEKYLNFYSTPFGEKILEKELELVELKLKDCKNVLSIGCGPALLEAKLQQLHPEMNIIGLESSTEMLKQASTVIHLEHGDAQHLKYDDNIFDAVLCVTSLEFVKEYKKALAEIRRVLKNKGIVLVLMLNPKSQYFRNEYKDVNSFIKRNIKHTDTEEIKAAISGYFFIKNETYSLGIQDGEIVDDCNPTLASLYIIEGVNNE